ncbi:UTP--glucose-1-phosphate uridylyltransferase [bacterium]|nr:UTP--glucose-1-phosphate uridylyltransferase [bacterium]
MSATRVVIPAAGFGTRFLPITKSMPKEMIPLVDKPAIQYVVEEAIASGVKEFVMVVSREKKAIEDHFDIGHDGNNDLINKDGQEILNTFAKMLKGVQFTSIRQQEQLGLGHAVWMARHLFRKEKGYFTVMLPDDVILGSPPALAQLLKIAAQERGSVVAVKEVPIEEVSRYGVIDIKKQLSPNLFQVKELIEKPQPSKAPSNLAIIGRYVLSTDLFDAFDEVSEGASGELQLTDAIQRLLCSGERVFAYRVQGKVLDVGTKLGWIKSNIEASLHHPVYGPYVREFLEKMDVEQALMRGMAAAKVQPRVR